MAGDHVFQFEGKWPKTGGADCGLLPYFPFASSSSKNSPRDIERSISHLGLCGDIHISSRPRFPQLMMSWEEDRGPRKSPEGQIHATQHNADDRNRTTIIVNEVFWFSRLHGPERYPMPRTVWVISFTCDLIDFLGRSDLHTLRRGWVRCQMAIPHMRRRFRCGSDWALVSGACSRKVQQSEFLDLSGTAIFPRVCPAAMAVKLRRHVELVIAGGKSPADAIRTRARVPQHTRLRKVVVRSGRCRMSPSTRRSTRPRPSTYNGTSIPGLRNSLQLNSAESRKRHPGEWRRKYVVVSSQRSRRSRAISTA